MARQGQKLLTALVLLCSCAIAQGGFVNDYTEDFTTWDYRNPVTTTADWDAGAGEIGLFPFGLSSVGTSPVSVRKVKVAGDYAFAIRSSVGLSVFDISDPEGPFHVTDFAAADVTSASDLAIEGDILYMTESDAPAIHAIDISDPEAPSLLYSGTAFGDPRGIAVSGNYAFVADYVFGGLVVYYAEEPSDLSFPVGWEFTSMPPSDVAVSGNYAYVTQTTSGIRVISIEDPTAPSGVITVSVGIHATCVEISGDVMVVGGVNGIATVDISNPLSPSFLGSVALPGVVSDISVSGDRVYARPGDQGLYVVDISEPANPEIEGNVALFDLSGGVDVAGEYAFAGDREFSVVRVGHVMRPANVGSIGTPAFPRAAAVQGDVLYLVSDGYIQSFDISDPTSPALLDELPPNPTNHYTAIDVAGDYAYAVGSGDVTFYVIDVSDPSDLDVPWGFAHVWEAIAVDIEGNYLYVLDARPASPHLHVYDISTPDSPAYATSLALTDVPDAMDIAGNYAFIVSDGAGVTAIDITDPTSPSAAGGSGTMYEEVDIVVDGDYAYVSDYWSELKIYDISDPTSAAFPLIGSVIPPHGENGRLAVAGDHVFLTSDALYVIDVSDPAAPEILHEVEGMWGGSMLGLSGDHLFVGASIGTGPAIATYEVFQSYWDPTRNIGGSTEFVTSSDPIVSAKLSAAQNESVQWELSPNGGASWWEFVPGGPAVDLGAGAYGLTWRSTHSYAGLGLNPACSDVEVVWFYDFPVIEKIEDVGNDQGRQVRLSWTRSAKDVSGSSIPITEYAIYRRIDGWPLFTASGGDKMPERRASAPASPGGRLAYPPGDWEFVMTAPARTEDEYTVVAPTLADSTIVGGMHYSTFFVSAMTGDPSEFFDSYPDSGYSVDNLEPFAPSGFAIDYSASENQLSWDESVDEDFQYFRIYRSTDPEFSHGPENLIHTATGVAWVNVVTEGWAYSYKITAVDFSGNESDPSSPETVTGVDPVNVIRSAVLHPGSPNPMAESTTICYDLPAETRDVTLEVFDMSGRLVRCLAKGPEEGGRRSVVWDGRNEAGDEVASGIYYCRLRAGNLERLQKIAVLR